MKWILIALIFYLLIGIVTAIALKQTPYAGNPLWAMILLWPLYLVS